MEMSVPALVMKAFSPLITQRSSPARRERVLKPAVSLPASGSVPAIAHIFWPVTISGSHFSASCSLPKRATVRPVAMLTIAETASDWSARATSSMASTASNTPRPMPPCFSANGIDITPMSPSFLNSSVGNTPSRSSFSAIGATSPCSEIADERLQLFLIGCQIEVHVGISSLRAAGLRDDL